MRNRTIDRFQELSICLLVVGRLGKSAELSLDSILDLNPKRICISADENGKEWILERTYLKKQDVLCFHNPTREDFQQIGIQEAHSGYSEFGQERFIRLTALKWRLISESLRLHPESDVMFSDLDILWFKAPGPELFEQVNQTLALVQDDSNISSNMRHYCTGIMIWFNFPESIQSLRKIYERQVANLQNSVLVPDEPTFNTWVKEEDMSEVRVLALDSAKYVVGHRYFSYSLSRNKIKNIHAFHANYVIGERAKFRRLKGMNLRHKNDPRWIVFFGLELLLKIFAMIRNRKKNLGK